MLKVRIYVSLSSGLATLLTLRVHDQGRSIKYPYFTLPQRRRKIIKVTIFAGYFVNRKKVIAWLIVTPN